MSISKTNCFNTIWHVILRSTRFARQNLLTIFLKGDIEEAHREKDNKCVFLTVHDAGTNHGEWEKLIEHETFEEIKRRAIFVHVDVPGQEDDAEDLPGIIHKPRGQKYSFNISQKQPKLA